MRRFETLILLLALSFYVWFLRRFGLADVLAYLRLAGWGLALTIMLEAVSRVANTLGWRVTINDYPRQLRFRELFIARVSGEAIDYVTPTAQLGGQLVMAMMVRRQLAMAVGLATVVVALARRSRRPNRLYQHRPDYCVALRSAPSSPFLADDGRSRDSYRPCRCFLRHPDEAAVLDALEGCRQTPSRPPRRSRSQSAADDADALLLDFYRRHRGRLALSCLCYLSPGAWARLRFTFC